MGDLLGLRNNILGMQLNIFSRRIILIRLIHFFSDFPNNSIYYTTPFNHMQMLITPGNGQENFDISSTYSMAESSSIQTFTRQLFLRRDCSSLVGPSCSEAMSKVLFFSSRLIEANREEVASAGGVQSAGVKVEGTKCILLCHSIYNGALAPHAVLSTFTACAVTWFPALRYASSS